MKLRGIAHKYGSNVDTDVIIPGKYLGEHEPERLAMHAMEGIDPGFVKRVREGDFIVAGRNFGCGSSREHAPLALRYAGIRAVLALSFARIFYRNAIDGGHLLPIEIGEDAYSGIDGGDLLELDLEGGILRDLTKGSEYRVRPLDPIVRRIVEAGGLFKLKPEELVK